MNREPRSDVSGASGSWRHDDASRWTFEPGFDGRLSQSVSNSRKREEPGKSGPPGSANQGEGMISATTLSARLCACCSLADL